MCGGRDLRAQVPGTLDSSYQPAVTDQGAQALVIQPDDKALLGGAFTTFNGNPVSPLIRLNADGTLDSTFSNSTAGILVPRENANVNALVVQTDGKIVASAFGTTTATPTLTRLKADGTLDPTFTTTLPAGGIMSMAIQPTGTNTANGSTYGGIIIGGNFLTVNTTTIMAIARLNADGSTDTSFVPPLLPGGTGASVVAQVQSLQVQPADGKIVLVGTANTGAGNASALLRLNADGSLDTAFPLVTPPTGSFQSLALQPDGNVLVAGNFTITEADGTTTIKNLARFNGVDGSLDTSFNAGTTFVVGPAQVVVQADGHILCSDLSGSDAALVRLNSDGSVDRNFSPGFAVVSSAVSAIALQPDGLIVAAGTLLLPNPQGNQPNISVARLIASTPAGAATASVTVPGTANPWLAPLGATDGDGDSVPAEAPVRVTGLALTAGTTLSFTATGLVGYNGTTPDDAPDGSAGYFVAHPPENGLSGVNAQVDGLMGVFIDDSLADPTNANAPTTLNFNAITGDAVTGGNDYATLQPALGQVFFIGDGVTSSAVSQQITVPTGAKHLVLGTMDGSGWYNNTGAFQVTVTTGGSGGGGTGSGGTTLTATTFDVDGYPDNMAATPPAIAPGAAITFTAKQGGTAAPGLFVRVQAAPFPADGNIHDIPEGSWTDLTDTTNGGDGFLNGDGNGNYTLITTQYPIGEVVAFRAISAASGQKDSISAPVGPFDFTTTTPPPATGLTITQSASTADDPRASVAIIGDQITYKFYVTNPGPATLTNVKITNVLPPTLQFQSADNGYVLTGGNVVTYTFPQLSPNPGNPLTLTLVASVTSNAIVGKTIVNNGYSVSSDATGIVQGAVPSGTTIIPALEVVLVGGGSAVIPGQSITYTLNVTNRSPGKIKGIKVTVPVPGPANVLAYSFVDANGANLPGPQTTTGSVSLNGGNLIFTLDSLKPNKAEHLEFTVVVPVDVDPAAAIVQEGAQVTTKTSVGGVNSFTLPDTTTPLTGAQAAYLPQIAFAKLPIDGLALEQLLGANPKLKKNLFKAVGAALADPTLIKEVEAIYPGLATFTKTTATIPGLVAAFNPDVSYESSNDSDTSFVSTVAVPTASDPTYVAFVLEYYNGGSATVADVVLQDQVPTGTSIYAPHSTTYNGSVIINKRLGSPASGGNLEILGGGTTLRFHVGDIAPGAAGFVIYKVRVLGPGEAGAPSVDSVITTSGSVLSSTSLSHTYPGQPDGQDLTVVGRYAYYFDSYTVSAVTSGDSPAVVYDIPYENTGSRKSKILEIDDPIPAGLAYVTTQLLDGNYQPLPTQDILPGAVEVPADPTNGTLVFHPPLFNPKGVLKPGQGGFIRVYFAPTGTDDGSFVHSPFIPASSYDTTSARDIHTPHPEAAFRPGTRATGSAPMVTATSRTLVDNGARAKIFVALVLPFTMVEGVPSDVFVVEGSLNDVTVNDTVSGNPVVTLPAGIDFGAAELGTDIISVTGTKSSDGTTQAVVDFVSELPAHSASVAKFSVTPEVGSAGEVEFPGCGVNFVKGLPLALQTGPVHVKVLTASDARRLPVLKGQVAGAVLKDVDTSSTLFNGFINNISAASHIAVLAGTSAVSASNGAFVVPLLGGNVLAMGPAGTVSGVAGQARTAGTAASDYVFATGASTSVNIGPAAGRSGVMTPMQTAGAMLSGIVNNTAGNAVTAGAASIFNGGAATIISQDGNGLISQDGNGSPTGQMASGLLSEGGAGLATGLANTVGVIGENSSGIISHDSGGIISHDSGGVISNDGGSVISNDGGSIVNTQGGQIITSSGAASAIGENSSGVIGENSSGLIGTPGQGAGIDANAAGCVNQVGSPAAASIISQDGGSFTGSSSLHKN